MKKLPNEIIDFYLKNQKLIRAKLKEFKSIPENKYFYELVYCLCTPMSKAENAMKVQQIFEQIDFFNFPIDPKDILRKPENYIRFHNQKSKYILWNRENFDKTLKIIKQNIDIFEKRNLLLRQVMGFGMKETAHFLRNIGQFSLPILDRHILRTMHRCGIIEQIPKNFHKKNYENLERIYIDWCNWNSISIEELDLVLWKLETGKILK